MPTNYATTGRILISDGADDGTTFSWSTAANSPTFSFITDQNDDGNLDIGEDNWQTTTWEFTGYYYTASNGQTFPIFVNTSNTSFFSIPFNTADYDLFADFPASGSLTTRSDDFQPTGVQVCFAAGTAISTPVGDLAVEDLRIGQEITTAEGNRITVKWIGRQMVFTRFGPAERLMPVRFAAGSLGAGLPHEDLTVTADHGMLVDGVICHAGALVNGTTIKRVPLAEMGETYTAETFIDNVSRRVFDNYAEFEALYGDVPEMEELPYPRAMSARQVPDRIRARLAGKAAAQRNCRRDGRPYASIAHHN